MAAGQDDDPARGLGDHGRGVSLGRVHHRAHHRPAEHVDRVGHDLAAAGRDQRGHRRAQRRLDQAGRFHLAGYGDHLAGHGRLVHGPGDRDQRAGVGNCYPDGKGQAQGRHGAAGDLLDQDLLVAGGVEVVDEGKRQARAGGRPGEMVNDFGVLAFERDDSARGSGDLDQGRERPDDVGRVVHHMMLIGMEQRLAFAAVGDDRVHASVVLHVGGKAGPAFTHDASRLHQRNESALFHAAPSVAF